MTKPAHFAADAVNPAQAFGGRGQPQRPFIDDKLKDPGVDVVRKPVGEWDPALVGCVVPDRQGVINRPDPALRIGTQRSRLIHLIAVKLEGKRNGPDLSGTQVELVKGRAAHIEPKFPRPVEGMAENVPGGIGRETRNLVVGHPQKIPQQVGRKALAVGLGLKRTGPQVVLAHAHPVGADPQHVGAVHEQGLASPVGPQNELYPLPFVEAKHPVVVVEIHVSLSVADNMGQPPAFARFGNGKDPAVPGAGIEQGDVSTREQENFPVTERTHIAEHLVGNRSGVTRLVAVVREPTRAGIEPIQTGGGTYPQDFPCVFRHGRDSITARSRGICCLMLVPANGLRAQVNTGQPGLTEREPKAIPAIRVVILQGKATEVPLVKGLAGNGPNGFA